MLFERLVRIPAGSSTSAEALQMAKCMYIFVFIVYKAYFTLSHMRASFGSIKVVGNFVFIGLLNNWLNLKKYKLTD